MDIDSTVFLGVLMAGVVSFLAPCTLPLIPAYLGFISGVTKEELTHHHTRVRAKRVVVGTSALFVLGFSIVFVLFGVLAGTAGDVLSPFRDVLTKIGGVMVIVLGLFMMGVVSVPALARTRQIRMPGFVSLGSPVTSVLLGAIFALGWTPCIGPVLATVLFLASSTETALMGGLLLALFSAGFGVPFLILAVLLSRADAFFARHTRALGVVSRLGGVFLVLFGLVLVSREFVFLLSWLYEWLSGVGYEEWLSRFL